MIKLAISLLLCGSVAMPLERESCRCCKGSGDIGWLWLGWFDEYLWIDGCYHCENDGREASIYGRLLK